MSRFRDEIRITMFALCVMGGVALAGSVSHPHQMIADWVDNGFYAAMGAMACFYFGPKRNPNNWREKRLQ